jgi:hypothetical protein
MKPYVFGVSVCLATVPVLAQPARTLYPCEASPEVRRALNRTPNLYDYTIPLEDRMKPIRALVEEYPGDVFVHQRYQDRFRRLTHLYQEFDRAFEIYRSRPADPVSRYLEARLTGSFDARQAEAMLTHLIAREPAFPWPHLAIAELTDRRGFRDTTKAETHLRAFLAACPESIEGYAMLRTVEDAEMIREGARNFGRCWKRNWITSRCRTGATCGTWNSEPRQRARRKPYAGARSTTRSDCGNCRRYGRRSGINCSATQPN